MRGYKFSHNFLSTKRLLLTLEELEFALEPALLTDHPVVGDPAHLQQLTGTWQVEHVLLFNNRNYSGISVTCFYFISSKQKYDLVGNCVAYTQRRRD